MEHLIATSVLVGAASVDAIGAAEEIHFLFFDFFDEAADS